MYIYPIPLNNWLFLNGIAYDGNIFSEFIRARQYFVQIFTFFAHFSHFIFISLARRRRARNWKTFIFRILAYGNFGESMELEDMCKNVPNE